MASVADARAAVVEAELSIAEIESRITALGMPMALEVVRNGGHPGLLDPPVSAAAESALYVLMGERLDGVIKLHTVELDEAATLCQLCTDLDRVDEVKKMLEAGASARRSARQEDVHFAYPLHGACAAWNIEAVKVLLAHNADVEHHGNCEFETALTVCASDPYQHVRDGKVSPEACRRTVQLLLAHGADVNRECGAGGPLSLLNGGTLRIELVELLLDHGANPNGLNDIGHTLLMQAAVHNEVDIVRTLLERGADQHIRDPHDQSTALILAAGDQHDGCLAVVQVLCAYGADMRGVDTSGATALSAACSVHGPEVALGHALCPPGAQTYPWLLLVEGWSALQIAAAVGVPEQAKAALRLGLIDTAGCALPELMSWAAKLLPKPGWILWCQEHRDSIAGAATSTSS